MLSYDIKMRLPNAAEFVALRNETDWGPLTLEQAAQALNHSLCGVSVYARDTLIGMIRVIGDGVLKLYVQDVIVAKDYRGNGIGKEMMTRLINYLRQHYPEDCCVGLMAAKGQSPFYEKFGFNIRPSATTDAGMLSPLSALRSSLVKDGTRA
jgi:ribosomal protein S18 acetylase RimI-like enzyme